MISYIRGSFAHLEPEEGLVVVETGGVGYGILISGKDLDLLPGHGEEIRLYTYLQVKEDGLQLYGFLTREDQKLFKMLIGVSGIGPKGALGILTALSADDLRFAVLSNDVKAICAAPGIGKKTAEKMILELRDKLKLEDALDHIAAGTEAEVSGETAVYGEIQSEAVQALVALGYGSTEALKAVRKVEIQESTEVEDVLKLALKYMAL